MDSYVFFFKLFVVCTWFSCFKLHVFKHGLEPKELAVWSPWFSSLGFLIGKGKNKLLGALASNSITTYLNMSKKDLIYNSTNLVPSSLGRLEASKQKANTT